jgi:hypothetical protein
VYKAAKLAYLRQDSISEPERQVILNLGCGSAGMPGCINIDRNPLVLLARIPIPSRFFGRRREFIEAIRLQNVRFGFARTVRMPNASLDGFYASRLLEHLALDQCKWLMERALDWLKPNGVLRVVLLDMRRLAKQYIAHQITADRFIQRTGMPSDSRCWWSIIFGRGLMRWLYDSDSFRTMLLALGYRDLRVCTYRNGRLPALAKLDVPRWAEESVYVEAAR